MTLAATADLVTAASTAGTAVLAFNAITIEHAEGIADGVERVGAAAVIQLSENTIRFHGGRMAPLIAACAQIAAQSSANLSIHLDHLQDVALLTEAVQSATDLGVTSIMVDAAHLSYRDNVERTRSFTRDAHAAGLWVEAELGEIGGKANAHAPGTRTDPAEAAAFAGDTAVDGLAVAVGSSHAMTTRNAQLDLGLIAALAADVAIPLVLHGSSGVPDDQLRRAVEAGIRKVNVGTALNVAFTAAIRDELAANAGSTDPRNFLAAGRRAIGDTVADLCRAVVGERVAR
ncbi:class II fructose-bisphosphate aldolase [Mycobacterium sp. URHB0044]|uniref:class II fructose-bisphosphate aldolase n=1 Tax=Mycobacterium sp. URHB0044 TaxID=1380386 RepID=UPI00048B42B7|nr:class II fructose-bisphosphate aldolase [Mycobacterium sp. URHB0044]